MQTTFWVVWARSGVPWSTSFCQSCFGTFTAGYGILWFAGSALIGILYDISLSAVITFCIVTHLLAIPIFILVGRHVEQHR